MCRFHVLVSGGIDISTHLILEFCNSAIVMRVQTTSQLDLLAPSRDRVVSENLSSHFIDINFSKFTAQYKSPSLVPILQLNWLW